MRRIERHIDDNLESPVGLAELADLAGLSRWYFLRVFQETAGMSPHDFVTRRRLDRARHLLRTTSRSVMDIAADIGMTHSHFSRVCTPAGRHADGVPPNQPAVDALTKMLALGRGKIVLTNRTGG